MKNYETFLDTFLTPLVVKEKMLFLLMYMNDEQTTKWTIQPKVSIKAYPVQSTEKLKWLYMYLHAFLIKASEALNLCFAKPRTA